MTDTGLFCPSCDRQSDDGLACQLCMSRLLQDLKIIPGLMAELLVTLTRQSQTGTGNGGRGSERAMPFDVTASEVGDEVKTCLVMWVRTFELGDGWPEDTPESICGWLEAREIRVRGHAEAKYFIDEMSDVVHRLRRVIDLRPEMVYLGVCVCGNQMYARARDEAYDCPGHLGEPCGKIYNIEARRRELIGLAADQLATVNTCARVLALFGLDVKADTVWNWTRPRTQRGVTYPARVWAKGKNDKGENLYRVGDIEALVRESLDRKRERDARKVG